MMKKILSLFLAFTIMISICACQGNFGKVNLQDAIPIPENGIIMESILGQIKNENAMSLYKIKITRSVVFLFWGEQSGKVKHVHS